MGRTWKPRWARRYKSQSYFFVMERFQMTVKRPVPKQLLLLWQIATGANSTIDQSEFLAITGSKHGKNGTLRSNWFWFWFWFCFSLDENLAQYFWANHVTLQLQLYNFGSHFKSALVLWKSKLWLLHQQQQSSYGEVNSTETFFWR